MGSKKTKSDTHSTTASPTTPTTAPNSAITPSTALTVTPCPHSDGTVPVCWDCVEAGHPSAGAAAATATATTAADQDAVVSPLSPEGQKKQRRKRSKASIFSKLSSSSNHSTLQVHPPEPGKEVIVADYQHLAQPGLEVLAGPRAVNPQSPSFYKNNNNNDSYNDNKNSEIRRADAENWDVESSTVRNHHAASSSKSGRRREGRILGMSKKRFWLSALLIGLLVVVITVGVVVGLQQTGKLAKNTSAQTNGGSGATPTTSAGPAATSSTSSSSTPGGSGPVTCPSANNSTYTLSDRGSTIKFKIGCGFSRDGNDLQSLTAGTFLQCLEECAKRTGCAGVSWINDGDAGSANNYCYTKLSMGGKVRNNVFAQSAEILPA